MLVLNSFEKFKNSKKKQHSVSVRESRNCPVITTKFLNEVALINIYILNNLDCNHNMNCLDAVVKKIIQS